MSDKRMCRVRAGRSVPKKGGGIYGPGELLEPDCPDLQGHEAAVAHVFVEDKAAKVEKPAKAKTLPPDPEPAEGGGK